MRTGQLTLRLSLNERESDRRSRGERRADIPKIKITLDATFDLNFETNYLTVKYYLYK